jgi:hypothetical protein
LQDGFAGLRYGEQKSGRSGEIYRAVDSDVSHGNFKLIPSEGAKFVKREAVIIFFVGVICARAEGAELAVEIGFKIAVNRDIELGVFGALKIEIDQEVCVFVLVVLLVYPYPFCVFEHNFVSFLNKKSHLNITPNAIF